MLSKWYFIFLVQTIISSHPQLVLLATEVIGSVIPYISLGETAGVATQSVPALDDGLSAPESTIFPIGCGVEYLVGVY